MKPGDLVPSQCTWGLEEFIHARYKQFEAAKDQPPHPLEEVFDTLIVIQPDDEVACDSCNSTIATPQIHMVEFGRRVVCEKCWQAWYQTKKITFRRLKADGSLGEYVKVGEL